MADVIQAIIFDLDDTLYDEIDYMRSGFQEVCRELERRGVRDALASTDFLERAHRQDRSDVLQQLAQQLEFPIEWIPALAQHMREHEPRIRLPEETVRVLSSLRRNFRLGCVTDGWLAVQQRKANALGVELHLDSIVFSDEFGRSAWKPHPRPFLECCARLKVEPTHALFVGDNPERDLVGAKNAGMRAIRIRRPLGYFSTVATNADVAPIAEVFTLVELSDFIVSRLVPSSELLVPLQQVLHT